jgi:NADPH:quinone reductase-like Zn-dependent oxidoreductase
MRAIEYASNGDATVLQLVQRPLQEPAEGEVLEETAAAHDAVEGGAVGRSS